MMNLDREQLTADWWRFFLNNLTQEPLDFVFIRGHMVDLKNKRVQDTENTVEHDKTIVIPIDNWISLGRKQRLTPKGRMRRLLTKTAATKMDRVVKMNLRIDDQDVPVPAQRIVSPMFVIHVDSSNNWMLQGLELGDVSIGTDYYAVSDGYWLFVEPNTLPIGTHIIQTYGSCATGLIELEIHHKLHVY